MKSDTCIARVQCVITALALTVTGTLLVVTNHFFLFAKKICLSGLSKGRAFANSETIKQAKNVSTSAPKIVMRHSKFRYVGSFVVLKCTEKSIKGRRYKPVNGITRPPPLSPSLSRPAFVSIFPCAAVHFLSRCPELAFLSRLHLLSLIHVCSNCRRCSRDSRISLVLTLLHSAWSSLICESFSLFSIGTCFKILIE